MPKSEVNPSEMCRERRASTITLTPLKIMLVEMTTIRNRVALGVTRLITPGAILTIPMGYLKNVRGVSHLPVVIISRAPSRTR
jgi:hypothetical protein